MIKSKIKKYASKNKTSSKYEESVSRKERQLTAQFESVPGKYDKYKKTEKNKTKNSREIRAKNRRRK